MTQQEREEIIKIYGIIKGMAMMMLPIDGENIYMANQFMDLSIDLESIAKGVDNIDLGKRKIEEADSGGEDQEHV